MDKSDYAKSEFSAKRKTFARHLDINNEMETDYLMQGIYVAYIENKSPKIATGHILFMLKLHRIVGPLVYFVLRGRWKSTCLIVQIMFVSDFSSYILKIGTGQYHVM